jgi:hypothetical protein
VSRLGAILIPLLGGFLLTIAAVSWRSDWRQARVTLSPPEMTPKRVEPQPSNLRVVHVGLSSDPWLPVASSPGGRNATAPEAASAPPTPPAVPRAGPGNSSGFLEAPARKFARGAKAEGY